MRPDPGTEPALAPARLQRRSEAPLVGLIVDARDVHRGIIRVTETLQVQPGRLIVRYPEWLPGYHAPIAPIEFLSGLRFSCDGVLLDWQRDAVEVHAFVVVVPDGATELRMEFETLCPTTASQGRVGVTLDHINLQWNAVILYPAGYKSKQIAVDAEVILPTGWSFACPLETKEIVIGTAAFKRTDLEMLVDSPLFAGRHFSRYEVEAAGPIHLNVFGDQAEQTRVGDQVLTCLSRLVAQADALFGARPFKHYDFLIATSDELGALGVEHQQSAEIVVPGGFFKNWGGTASKNDLLAHEYIHAWNGKYRRGRDACTDAFNEPIRNSLLWVYEGLTQYYGQVLATRSGLWRQTFFKGALARTAAQAQLVMGRKWRPLRDTTRDPIITAREEIPWPSWQRAEDYYSDGQLIWLEVDGLMRQITGEEISLDQFARAFFSAPGHLETLPYDFSDIVTALDKIVPFAWEVFFQRHLTQIGGDVPLRGLELAGHKIVFAEEPNSFHKMCDSLEDIADHRFSAGFSVKTDGTVAEVIWESAAFDAGLTPGVSILSVNGHDFSAAYLRRAIAQSADRGGLQMDIRKLKRVLTVDIPYAGPVRYPHLVPVAGARDRLKDILRPARTIA